MFHAFINTYKKINYIVYLMRVGRPKIYHTDEARREAIKRSKNRYMLNTIWKCNICNNDHEYSLAGKTMHIKSKKHKKNASTYENNKE